MTLSRRSPGECILAPADHGDSWQEDPPNLFYSTEINGPNLARLSLFLTHAEPGFSTEAYGDSLVHLVSYSSPTRLLLVSYSSPTRPNPLSIYGSRLADSFYLLEPDLRKKGGVVFRFGSSLAGGLFLD